ncbi:hypothetical protein LTR66_011155, partial [Elasticomyces elasticus]
MAAPPVFAVITPPASPRPTKTFSDYFSFKRRSSRVDRIETPMESPGGEYAFSSAHHIRDADHQRGRAQDGKPSRRRSKSRAPSTVSHISRRSSWYPGAKQDDDVPPVPTLSQPVTPRLDSVIDLHGSADGSHGRTKSRSMSLAVSIASRFSRRSSLLFASEHASPLSATPISEKGEPNAARGREASFARSDRYGSKS